MGAYLDPLPAGVADRGGLRFAQQFRAAQPRHLADAGGLHGLHEQSYLVRSPAGRAGQRDAFGQFTFPLGDPLPYPVDQRCGKLMSRPRHPAHQQRDLITDPALELPHHTVGVGERAALRGLPDHQRAVSGQEQHRRYGGRAAAQRNDVGFQLVHGRPAQRRGRVRRAEVDPQPVRHRHHLPTRALPRHPTDASRKPSGNLLKRRRRSGLSRWR